MLDPRDKAVRRMGLTYTCLIVERKRRGCMQLSQ